MRARLWAAARLAAPWLALAGVMLCWCLADGYAAGARGLTGLTTLQCENIPISAGQADEIRRVEERTERPMAFAVWRQMDAQQAQDAALGRARTVSVIALRGDSTLALPVEARLAEGDRYGCILDAATAYELYGSRAAVGCELKLNDRIYTVRGVFDAPEATVAVWADAQEQGLNRVTLATAGETAPRRAAEEFAMRHGLEPSMTSLTDGFGGWARWFSRLALWAMGIAAFARIARELPHRRYYPVQKLLLVLLLAGFAALWLWAAGFRPEVPQSLVPTRWSDFEFWQRTAQRYWEWFLELLYMKKNRPDILLLGLLCRSAAYGLAGLALFCFGARKMRLGSGLEWFAAVAFSLCCGFAGLLAAHRLGLSPDLGYTVWAVPPLYLSAARLASWLLVRRPREESTGHAVEPQDAI